MQEYDSIYGASGKITGTQYIAELLISRNSRRNKVSLPDKFWNDLDYKTWKAEFLRQKRQADALVKAGYSVSAILSGLKQKRFQYCYSLFNQQLQRAIHEEQRKMEVKEKVIEEKPVVEISQTVISRPNIFRKQNKLGKLRD